MSVENEKDIPTVETLVNQMVKEGEEKTDLSFDPFVKIQEDINLEELTSTYIDWHSMKVTNDKELKEAKKSKSKVVSLRTGVSKKRKEITQPLNEITKRLITHEKGLVSMITKVEDVIDLKICEYTDQVQKEYERKQQEKIQEVDDFYDPIYKIFNEIKTIDDCNYLIEEVEKFNLTEEHLGEIVWNYHLEILNTIKGKIVFAKEKLQKIKQDEMDAREAKLKKKEEDLKKKEEEQSKPQEEKVEDIPEKVESPIIKIREAEPIKIDTKTVKDEKELEQFQNYSDMFHIYEMGRFKEFSERISKLEKSEIHLFFDWIISYIEIDSRKIVSMLKYYA